MSRLTSKIVDALCAAAWALMWTYSRLMPSEHERRREEARRREYERMMQGWGL